MVDLILGNVDYGMVRCSFNRSSISCTSMMNTQNYSTSECEQPFFPIEWSLVEDNFLSVCGTIPWWLPLLIASTLLAIFQLLGILVIVKYLNKIVDPINMLAVSQNCCCLAPVWREDEEEVLKPIQTFMKNPSKESMDEANNTLAQLSKPDLINLSINNGYFELIKIITIDLEVPVTKELMMTAFQRGNVKIIKMFINVVKEKVNNMVRFYYKHFVEFEKEDSTVAMN